MSIVSSTGVATERLADSAFAGSTSSSPMRIMGRTLTNRHTSNGSANHAGTSDRATQAVAEVSLSLVLPCYNEVLNIERTIREAQAWFAKDHIDGQIIVTDDGSKDGSLALLLKLQEEMPNLKIVHHEKNRGYGAAIRSGCDQADMEWIAFMDSDGQFKSEDIAKLLPLTTTAAYVTGIRAHRADTFQRWLNSRMYQTLVRVLLGITPTDLNCGLKLFHRSIWATIRPVHATGALINAEMFYLMKQSKIGWQEAEVPHYPRQAGKPTGANPRVILRMFKELWQLKRAKSADAAAQAIENHDDAELVAQV